jgi:hypothetical protein
MKMAVFICGINPAGLAHKTKMLEVGDEVSLSLLLQFLTVPSLYITSIDPAHQ